MAGYRFSIPASVYLRLLASAPFLFFGSAVAQPLFTNATQANLPQAPDLHSLDAEFGDVDNDGDLDILIAVENGANRLYLNDGKAKFTWKQNAFSSASADGEDLAVEDFDRDGNLDVVVGNESGKNRLLFNNGEGIFTDGAANLPIPYQEETREVLLVDVDNDGDKDIVFCNLTCNACGTFTRNPQVRLLINDGKGKFTDETSTRMPPNTFSSWDGGYLDFDADGDQDLILCAIEVPGFTGLSARAYRNDGTGKFTDVTATVMPAGASGRLWDVEVADLDKDGTLDVFMGAWGTQAILMLGTVDQPVGIRAIGKGIKPGKHGSAPKPVRPGSGVRNGRAAGVPFHWKGGEKLSDGRALSPGP